MRLTRNLSLLYLVFSTNLITNISSHISIIMDGWSTKGHCLFSSFSIQYIHSPPEDPHAWCLKSHLIEFKHSVGQHTGNMIGEEMVVVIKKYGMEKKVY